MGEPVAVQARHLSGASIGKLIEWEVGRDTATGAHVWSPVGVLVNVWHGKDSTEISINYDYPGDYADTLDQIGLKPDSWVRITQAPLTVGPPSVPHSLPSSASTLPDPDRPHEGSNP